MRHGIMLLAAMCVCTHVAAAQDSKVQRLLLVPSGDSFGSFLVSPSGLSANQSFVFPSSGGTLLVSPSSGVSPAWLLGGNDLTSTPLQNIVGTTSAHDLVLVAGGATNVRLTLDDATAAVTVNNGGQLRFEEAGGTNFSAFVAGAQTADITYRLPLTGPTANQVLRANATTPTDLEWASITSVPAGSSADNTLRWNGSAWAENAGVTADASNNLHILGNLDVDGTATIGSLNGIVLATSGVLSTTVINGTADQVIVTNGVGTITLSTPQNIATTSSPSFAGLTLSNTGAPAELRIVEETSLGGQYTAFVAGDQTANITYRLPLTGPTANQVLRANATTPTDLEWSTLLINLGTDVTGTLPIGNGGTGATTAVGARSSLGLEIGVDVQAYDADLTALAALNTNGMMARIAANSFATRTITGSALVTVTHGDGVSGDPTITLTGVTATDPGTAADQTLFWDNVNNKWIPNSYLKANGTTVTVGSLNGVVRATAGVLGTGNVNLASEVTGTLPLANGGTGATTAPAARTALGLAIGTDVQAWDADLDALAAMSTNGLMIRNGTSYLTRSLTAGTGITITNADGTAGNPTIAVNGLLLPAGTTTHATLRYNGTTWVENTNVLAQPSGLVQQAGNLQFTNATTASVIANRELVLEQQGDTFGWSRLKIQHRNGSNGALFETQSGGGAPDLVDFGFKPGAGPQSNIRLEFRPGTLRNTANTTYGEFQYFFGTTTTPQYAVSFGTAASSFEVGNVSIGHRNPLARFTVGGASQEFRVNASGDLIRINNVPYTWPTANAVANGYALTSTTAGALSWSPVQAGDADLDALAALTTNGIVVRTGAGTATTRTLAVSSPLSITNANGVGGDPSITFTGELLPTTATLNSTLRWNNSDWVENPSLLADGTNVRTTGALDVDGNFNVDGSAVTFTALPTTTTAGDLLTIDGSNVVRRVTVANAVGTSIWTVGGNTAPSSGVIGITGTNTTDLELWVNGSQAVVIDDASKQVSINNDLMVNENTTLGEEDADQTTIRGSVNINTTTAGGLNVNINTSAFGNTTTIGSNTVGNTVVMNAPVVTAANLPQTGVHTDEIVLQDGSGNLRTATINGTADQISVSSSAGALTIGTPQNIGTSSTPTFASMTLSATSNQLTLGTTTTTTITAPTPAAGRTYTLSDVGANASFVMTEGAQTINGAKSFRDNTVVGGGSGAAELRITEATGAGDHYSAFKVGAQGNNITYTLPDATPTENQVLRATSVSGTNVTMSWTPTVTIVRNGTTDATNNDVTLQNATELAVSVSANTNYNIDALIRTQNTASNANMDIGFTLPSGTATFSIERADANGGESAIFDQAAPVITNIDTDAAVRIFRIQGVVYVGGTGGTLQLVFKRRTAGADSVQILDGTYLSVTR